MARIRQITEALNWELFCEKRSSADEELVDEFYVNLTSNKLTEVFICEIKVPITSNIINEFFELPDFEDDEYSSLVSNIKFENLQEILEELIVSEQMVLLYSILTGKTIDVGKIILREMQNCAAKRSGPTYFPFTITILCLKAKILANVKKIGYSQGTITYWNLYRIAGDSILKQRVEETEDPKEEEKDPIKIEPRQSAEIPNKAEPMELVTKPDVATSMFKTQSPHPDL
ncbi:hypothetical protein PVK06_008238 [Gossypium arboreum]|uniref:Putative plant transposon protein domain-containing protein n=1 Tax=Gossypium arboreum TaxID=29729 RepID=A0ABR0QKG6_GOSAR|nr:hypothetical protein PVK06_008238 [Gossypium arboreum]